MGFLIETKVFLIRHCEPAGHDLRVFNGRFDSPLVKLGVNQALALKKRFENEKIDVVFTSPLVRAKHTADLVFGGRNVPIVVDSALVERSFGVLDGLPLEEAKKIHSKAEDIYEGKARVRAEGVEPLSAVRQRAYAGFVEIVEENAGKNIVIVSHVMWIKSLLCKLCKVPLSRMDSVGYVKTSSVSVVHVLHTGNGRIKKTSVHTVGDTSHLSQT